MPDNEIRSILLFCHDQTCGHLGPNKTAIKVLQCRFYWPSIFKDTMDFCINCNRGQQLVRITKRDLMPLNNVQVMELFDVWGIDFMSPFLNSFESMYILLEVDYVSK